MTDNGAAMMAEEFSRGLHRLASCTETTLPYSPYQNAKQESFWGRVEGRLMAMLEGVGELTLELLNTATRAWVEQEYQRSVHSAKSAAPTRALPRRPRCRARMPRQRGAASGLPPGGSRRQRRSDGTVASKASASRSPAIAHLERVHLRYARWDLCGVDLVDARRGNILCALYPWTSPPTPMASAGPATP